MEFEFQMIEWPSGFCLLTWLYPMAPPPPVRFITGTGTPKSFAIPSAR